MLSNKRPKANQPYHQSSTSKQPPSPTGSRSRATNGHPPPNGKKTGLGFLSEQDSPSKNEATLHEGQPEGLAPGAGEQQLKISDRTSNNAKAQHTHSTVATRRAQALKQSRAQSSQEHPGPVTDCA